MTSISSNVTYSLGAAPLPLASTNFAPVNESLYTGKDVNFSTTSLPNNGGVTYSASGPSRTSDPIFGRSQYGTTITSGPLNGLLAPKAAKRGGATLPYPSQPTLQSKPSTQNSQSTSPSTNPPVFDRNDTAGLYAGNASAKPPNFSFTPISNVFGTSANRAPSPLRFNGSSSGFFGSNFSPLANLRGTNFTWGGSVLGQFFRTNTSSASRASVARQVGNEIGKPLQYSNYSDGTSFRKWAEDGAKGVPPDGSKNCWEAFLEPAVKQGRLSPQRVADAYKSGAAAIQNLLTNNLQDISPYVPGNGKQPQVGDLVYFKLTQPDGRPFTDAQGKPDPAPFLDHVGMVVGYDAKGQPVIANNFPKAAETTTGVINGRLETTSINSMSDRLKPTEGQVSVYYGRPPW
jgi:hypothetical protein